MKKILFAGLILLLAVSLLGITSCSKSSSTATEAPMSTLNQSTSNPQTSKTTPSSTAKPVTTSASAGYDWSKVPVYAGSTEATDLENAQGGPSPQIRVYVANVSPIGKVIDYYSSELPNNGWMGTDAVNGTEVLATNGSYDLTVEVAAMTNDNYPSDNCEINFSMLPR